MVWLKSLILLFFLLLYSKFIYSNELNEQENKYFNFIDLDNDGAISFLEIEQSINLLFQIIDLNQDKNISKDEIIELKNIVDSIR